MGLKTFFLLVKIFLTFLQYFMTHRLTALTFLGLLSWTTPENSLISTCKGSRCFTDDNWRDSLFYVWPSLSRHLYHGKFLEYLRNEDVTIQIFSWPFWIRCYNFFILNFWKELLHIFETTNVSFKVDLTRKTFHF